MRVLSIAIAALMTCVALFVAGCGSRVPEPTSDGPAVQVPSDSPRKVLFDMGHGEVFGLEDTTELGHSDAVSHILELGMDVVVNRGRFTTETVAGVDGIILAGPMQLPTFEEQDVLERYVADGGVLVITTHVAYPILVLPQRYGLELVPMVITSENPVPGMDQGTFTTSNIEPSDLTSGVSQIVLLSSWGVDVTDDNARIAISSMADTWADSDGDRVRTAADAAGPFGLVGVSSYGQGTVVLVGDDAVFANAAIGQSDNTRLFDNILRLMGAHAYEA